MLMGRDLRRRNAPQSRRRGRGGPQLVPMWLALGGTLVLAAAVAAVVTWLGLRALHFREFQPEPRLSAATLYDLLKIAFAVAVGVGGVVALVTSYRRQRIGEFAERREGARLFNERFATAAGQLGSESPAVRLAGVYAMAGLADDWPERRQTCVDVLCAFLRMPSGETMDEDTPVPEGQAFRASREVRHTVIRVITAHLQPNNRRATAAQDWRELNFDFTDAIFDGGDFSGAQFLTGEVSFRGAQFSDAVSFRSAKFSGAVSFGGARFSHGMADFQSAEFSGGTVDFRFTDFSGGTIDFRATDFSGGTVSFGYAQFSGGTVNFSTARFSRGEVGFGGARFSRGTVDFRNVEFSGGTVGFWHVEFSGSTVNFSSAKFAGGEIGFRNVEFSGGTVDFNYTWFSRSEVDFSGATFSGGEVDFSGATFSGGTVSFSGVRFLSGKVDFHRAQFSGGDVDFRLVAEWSLSALLPDWNETPAGVLLPASLPPEIA